MIRGRRRRSSDPDRRGGRRSGPAGEERWWDPLDQAFAEAPHLEARDLGRGWASVAMVNNAERLDPHGTDLASRAVAEAAAARRRTALDEGQAWRRRDGDVLAVLRIEVFADGDDAAHRATWREHAEAALDATWRERWQERGRDAGWVEARWVKPEARPDPLHAFSAAVPAAGVASDVDWVRVEDHTGDGTAVAVYEHLTVWAGRAHATLIVRHDLALDLDAESAAAVSALHRSLRAGPPTGA